MATMAAMGSLRDPNEVVAFAQAESRARGVAGRLQRLGVTPGTRVALRATNGVPGVVVLLALIHLDVSVVLINPRLGRDEVEGLLASGRVQLVVSDAPSDQAEVPGCNVVDLDRLVTGPSGAGRVDPSAWRARRDGLIMVAGGSTGRHHVVAKPGGELLDNMAATARAVGYRPDDVLCGIVPLSHQYGVTLLLAAWSAGCSLVLPRLTRLDRDLDLLARHGATVMDATPAVWARVVSLARRNEQWREALRALRLRYSGAAAIAPETAAAVGAELGGPLLDCYGSTELGNISYATPSHAEGCGRLLDDVVVEVVDAGGRAVPPGELGHLMVGRAGGGAIEYAYVDPDGSMHWHGGPGLHPTGDLGRLGRDGQLRLAGRAERCRRPDATVWTATVEEHLRARGHDVQCVAVPHAEDLDDLVVFTTTTEADHLSTRPWPHCRDRSTRSPVTRRWPGTSGTPTTETWSWWPGRRRW
ncbi:hypothetical protein GCM10027418_00370 [Mariniluteicoccus endophyticus]